MKRVITILSLLLLLLCGAVAQSISQYEYWTDDDYASRSVVNSGSSNISLDVSTATLSAGVHFLNFRACRSDGTWGNFYRYLYYIPTITSSASGNLQVKYWLDDQLVGANNGTVSGNSLSLSIDISGLTSGIHYFNCTPMTSTGEIGSSERLLFYIPCTDYNPNARLASAEYWIDDDYAHKVSMQTESTTQVFTIDVSQLSSGVHYFNYRAIDRDGRTGTMIREIFYLAHATNDTEAELLEYEYWIDNNTADKVTGSGVASEYMFTIDVSSLSATKHTFNFRAKNVSDNWGPTFTAEFDMTGPTVIDQMEVSEEKFDVYNLSGLKIKTQATLDDLKALPSGLYIYGGKKILVP